jgi:hypothetical protein
MEKKYFVVLIILFQVSNLTAQTFSGTFPNDFGENGTAVYKYKIVDGKSIKHGVFTYEYKTLTYIEKIAGQFKDGLRIGKWVYEIRFVDDRRNDGKYYSGQITMSSGYNNGLPEGDWIFYKLSKKRSGVRTADG